MFKVTSRHLLSLIMLILISSGIGTLILQNIIMMDRSRDGNVLMYICSLHMNFHLFGN